MASQNKPITIQDDCMFCLEMSSINYTYHVCVTMSLIIEIKGKSGPLRGALHWGQDTCNFLLNAVTLCEVWLLSSHNSSSLLNCTQDKGTSLFVGFNRHAKRTSKLCKIRRLFALNCSIWQKIRFCFYRLRIEFHTDMNKKSVFINYSLYEINICIRKHSTVFFSKESSKQ